MRVIVIIISILLALPALAAPTGKNDRAEWNPPARYDHPYAGKLIEHRLPQQAVRRYCAKLFAEFEPDLAAGMHQRGCAIRRPDFCVIAYIDRPYGLTTPQAARRHEIGHCNGWPADHSD